MGGFDQMGILIGFLHPGVGFNSQHVIPYQKNGIFFGQRTLNPGHVYNIVCKICLILCVKFA